MNDDVEALAKRVMEAGALLAGDDSARPRPVVNLSYGRSEIAERLLKTDNMDPWHASWSGFIVSGATAAMALLELHQQISLRLDEALDREEKRATEINSRVAAMRAAREARK